jgi:hypothetical protein
VDDAVAPEARAADDAAMPQGTNSSSGPPTAAGDDAWDRIDGRGARGGPDSDLASRRPPPGPFSAAPARPRGRGRLVAGIALLVVAVALLIFGLVRQQAPAGETALARFSLPAGWTDRTAELAPKVPGVRPAYVFSGPATDGFAADINVVRQARGAADPPLDRLVTLVAAQVRTQLKATPAGKARPLTLDGEQALAYDYRYTTAGKKIRARQIAVYHAGSVVFVNFTTTDRVFARDAKALDQMVSSWRWAGG